MKKAAKFIVIVCEVGRLRAATTILDKEHFVEQEDCVL